MYNFYDFGLRKYTKTSKTFYQMSNLKIFSKKSLADRIKQGACVSTENFEWN